MNFDTFNPSADWNQQAYNLIFQAIYPNLFKISEFSQESGHWWAIANIVRAAAMIRVTDTYGPIPYSQVKDGLMYVPYDSHEEVYTNIFNDLQTTQRSIPRRSPSPTTPSTAVTTPHGHVWPTRSRCASPCVRATRRV